VLYTDNVDNDLALLQKRGLQIMGDDSGCPLSRDPDGHWYQLVDPGQHQ
jgi:hypothetical protein